MVAVAVAVAVAVVVVTCAGIVVLVRVAPPPPTSSFISSQGVCLVIMGLVVSFVVFFLSSSPSPLLPVFDALDMVAPQRRT